MKRKKITLWLALLSSIPATYYAGVSVIFYLWLNAAEPERWPATKALLWAGGSFMLAIIFFSLFVYCIVSLIKIANKEDDESNQET